MTQEQMKWGIIAAVGLAVLSLVISGIVLFQPAPDPTPLFTLSVEQNEEDLARSFRDASEDAERAVESINTMLSLLQGFGVIVGFVGGALAILGFNNFRRIQHQLREGEKQYEQIEAVRQNIEAIRQEYETQRQTGQQEIAQLRAAYSDQLQAFAQLSDRLESDVHNTAGALSLVQFAQQQIAIGNLESAAAILESACALDNDNQVAHYFLGDVNLRMDRTGAGIKHLQIAREADDYDLPSADASYAYLLRLQGDQSDDAETREEHYFQAEQIFRDLWHRNPDLLDITGESVYGAMAGLCRRQGRDDEAMRWYERCLQITPNNTYPLNNLALLRLQKTETREAALADFRRISELARQKLRFNYEDYWLWFDYLTARIALDEGYDAIKDDLATVFNLTDPLVQPLEKFVNGLDDLKVLPTGPRDINKVQVGIRNEIERRRGTSGDDT